MAWSEIISEIEEIENETAIGANNEERIGNVLRSLREGILADSLNPFAGKKLAVLGDSITYGMVPAQYTEPAQYDSYAKLAAQDLGMIFHNAGISGSTVANKDGAGANNPMVNRYTSLPDDADYIGIMGGTNDVKNSIPVGTINDTTSATFYGALIIIVEGLINKYWTEKSAPQKRIFLMTPIKSLSAIQPYCDAIKAVGYAYSIPVLDMQNESTLVVNKMKTINYFSYATNIYTPDGIHPNQEGHRRMANRLSGFIKTI